MIKFMNDDISRKMILLSLAALIAFTAGFFILYGMNAANSGSWKYVINTRDDYGYWACSKGASENPASTGNPYYYEERGKGQTIPYPTSSLVGWLAKKLHLPVLFFFPFWHILLPFLIWLVLTYCLTIFWRFPAFSSGVFSLIFLLSTLFLRSTAHENIHRYTRPGDALWMLFIWLSYVMNVPKTGKRAFFCCLFSVVATVWFNPFFAVLGGIANFFESIWQWFAAKDRKRAVILWILLSGFILSSLLYAGYIKINMAENPWVFKIFAREVRGARQEGFNLFRFGEIDWTSVILCLLAWTAVFGAKKISKTSWTPIDRLVAIVFSVHFLFSNIHAILPGKFQLASHVYYFVQIELLCMIGWLYEKLPLMIESPFFKKMEKFIFCTLAIVSCYVLFDHRLTFLRFKLDSFVRHARFEFHDNALLHLGVLPVLLLLVLAYVRFAKLRNILHRRWVAAALIVSLSVAGYVTFPRQNEIFNRRFPFDGAYQWLNRHAQKNDVVLTAPHTRNWIDYLILYTDLKCYIHPNGDILAHGSQNSENLFRFLIYFNLLTGDVNSVNTNNLKNFKPAVSLEDKVNRLRLNYVLIERSTPFFGSITRQLQGFLNEVYSDDKCVLFRVEKIINIV